MADETLSVMNASLKSVGASAAAVKIPVASGMALVVLAVRGVFSVDKKVETLSVVLIGGVS